MDEFINTLDPQKFRSTNEPWNQLMLNAPWSVGYVSTLIELKAFKSKEEWEKFYHEMGEYRLKKIDALSEPEKQILNNELLIKTNKQQVNKLSWTLKNLNTQHGRTKKELDKKGKILYDHIHERFPKITEDECKEAVRFRVICETWNGIILREHKTIKTLKSKFPNLNFAKKEGVFDHKYAVDYEIYNDSRLICGIQIKPKSYTYSTPYINRARAANQRKNKLYTDEFKKPVFDIIASNKGLLLDLNPIREINKLIES